MVVDDYSAWGDPVKAHEVLLERFRYIAGRAIPDTVFRGIDIERVEDKALHELAYRLKYDVFGEHLERTKVQYPADWWQAFKEQAYRFFRAGNWPRYGHWPWFGDYAARRWPVRYTVVEIDVRALYPKISLPDESHHVVVVRTELPA